MVLILLTLNDDAHAKFSLPYAYTTIERHRYLSTQVFLLFAKIFAGKPIVIGRFLVKIEMKKRILCELLETL